MLPTTTFRLQRYLAHLAGRRCDGVPAYGRVAGVGGRRLPDVTVCVRLRGDFVGWTLPAARLNILAGLLLQRRTHRQNLFLVLDDLDVSGLQTLGTPVLGHTTRTTTPTTHRTLPPAAHHHRLPAATCPHHHPPTYPPAYRSPPRHHLPHYAPAPLPLHYLPTPSAYTTTLPTRT